MSKFEIDLTGFIVEDIDLTIGDYTFKIPTDPDIESYVYLLKFLSGKFNTEDYIEAQKGLIISLIVNNNKNVDIAAVKKILGPTALEQFMKPYLEILIKKGILKLNDKTEKTEKSDKEKKNQKTRKTKKKSRLS